MDPSPTHRCCENLGKSFPKGSFRGTGKSEDRHNKQKWTKGIWNSNKGRCLDILVDDVVFLPSGFISYGAVNESNSPILMVNKKVPNQHESCFLHKRDPFPLRVNKTKQYKIQYVHFPHCFHTNPLFEKQQLSNSFRDWMNHMFTVIIMFVHPKKRTKICRFHSPKTNQGYQVGELVNTWYHCVFVTKHIQKQTLQRWIVVMLHFLKTPKIHVYIYNYICMCVMVLRKPVIWVAISSVNFFSIYRIQRFGSTYPGHMTGRLLLRCLVRVPSPCHVCADAHNSKSHMYIVHIVNMSK